MDADGALDTWSKYSHSFVLLNPGWKQRDSSILLLAIMGYRDALIHKAIEVLALLKL